MCSGRKEQPRLTARGSDTCRAMEGNVGSLIVLFKLRMRVIVSICTRLQNMKKFQMDINNARDAVYR